MCKIVKDIRQVIVSLGSTGTSTPPTKTGNEEILELEAKGYQMFFAPVVIHDMLVYTLTLVEEVETKKYEELVKKSIEAL